MKLAITVFPKWSELGPRLPWLSRFLPPGEIQWAIMTLSSIVLSCDSQEISVLECILGGLHIGVDVEPEPAKVCAKLSKSRVDALIVDSEVEGSGEFLQEFQKLKTQNSVPLVILNGPRNTMSPPAESASFLFQKPISVEQAVHILSSARNMILERRLHYHRVSVDTQISLCADDRKVRAQMINISQGGARIHGDFNQNFSGSIQMEFRLPETSKEIVLCANVAWADRNGNAGVQFVDVPLADYRTLQLWLQQQYFIQ